MNYYIHNINPILVELIGPLALRWYGISYLMGFIASILLLRHWAKRGEFEVPEKEVSNFIVLLAFFGVFLGGRLGYVVFYGFDSFLADPLYVFRVWDGGMSSHGGFIGVVLFLVWYARKNNHSFLNLADNMAATTSLGFAFGRLANFVNGELWGRATDAPWAVVFPQEAGLHYGQYDLPAIRQMVADGTLHPRHPSQLYQAAVEGFLVFGFMLLLRRTRWGKRPGALGTSYLILYAFARIAMEFFREPDNNAFFFGSVTKGQFYSALMIVGTLAAMWKIGILKRDNAAKQTRI
ncbi:prolipoprotein diacylglyceryl transferase [Pontiella sp.]|uniref:prolipoprotein diacylglyceryl transferase n=1 Tax=Pontiella sp. TaxID=2837462 RepID=UPI003569B2C0